MDMTEAEGQVGSWLSETTGVIMSSIYKVKNRMGVLAERLDEIGAHVLNNVDKNEKPIVMPHYPIIETPRAIVHANGDVTELISINSLPVELIHRILLNLKPTAKELSTVSSVSKTWYCLSRDRQIWTEMHTRYEAVWYFLECPIVEKCQAHYSREDVQPTIIERSHVWFTPKSFLFNDLTVALSEAIDAYRSQVYPNYDDLSDHVPNSVFNANERHWIRLFKQQFEWNRLLASTQKKPLNNPSSLMKKLRAVPIVTVPVFGTGVCMAQQAIYDLVNFSAQGVSMHDGVLGIGAGLGFHYEGTIFKLAGIHNPPNPFHDTILNNPIWHSFFLDSGFYFYAVSPSISLQETRDDLQSFLSLNFATQPEQRPVARPIFVLSFITDSSASEVAHAIGLSEMAQDRVWAIKKANDTIKDLQFAFQWAKSVIQ